MRIVKAKVLATGKEKFLVEKENEPGVFFEWFGNEEYKADELEVSEVSARMDVKPVGGMPKYEPLDTAVMMKEVLDSVKSHFWRDQRVEIAKILLRRDDVIIWDVAEKADKIMQKLKEYGD